MRAVYAGSFDPFTYGHLSVVREAALLFDEVSIVIASNPNKQRLFNRNDMMCAIMMCMMREDLRNVTVFESDDLTADVCRRLGAHYLVRGLRNAVDYFYEEDMAKFNQQLYPDLRTVYVRATDDHISSSAARELWRRHKSVDGYVPPDIAQLMNRSKFATGED